MSSYKNRKFLSNTSHFGKTTEEIRELFRAILNNGIHGISFSAYLEGQGPGSQLSIEQIRDRMKILQPHVEWVRSFSCVDGNEFIPQVAHEFGIKTLVGAWLGDDPEKNEEEINALIEVAKAGYADMIAVGNEVLYREELGEEDIIKAIERVKAAVPGIPVGCVDVYFQYPFRPKLVEACDVLLINCYPFWEGCPLEFAVPYMKDMYRQVVNVAQGKEVIIAETGWPNLGTPERGSVPSLENAMKYFIDTYSWAEEEEVGIFYFSSFDEAWKIGAEGDVGAYWGLWDKDGNLKY